MKEGQSEKILPCPKCRNSDEDYFLRGINNIWCTNCRWTIYAVIDSFEVKSVDVDKLIKQWNKYVGLENEKKPN